MRMWTECFVIFLAIAGTSGFVNLVRDQGFNSWAAMISNNGEAYKAIDGNTDQNSCAITDFITDKQTKTWWKVWLQQKFNIGYLEIYFKSDAVQTSTGFSIYTYDTQNFYPLNNSDKTLVYRHDPLSGCPASIMNITVNNVTQGIVFINERPPGYTTNCLGDNHQYTGIGLCEVKVMGCDENRYSDCGLVCKSECKNRHCDAFNGSCIHGCSQKNEVTIDCIECVDGGYIREKACVTCQGHCLNGEHCNKLSGRCDNGCQNHWHGDFCEVCPRHYYDTDCSTPCGKCSGDDVCLNVTGHCPNGCNLHWKEPKCDVCVNYYYGTDCNTTCGNCGGDDVCDSVTGHCPNGCKPHWTGPRCDECVDHFYGSTCSSPCGLCKGGEACDKRNGNCADGCIDNVERDKCDVCKDGFYDIKLKNCSAKCGHCFNGASCDKLDGKCAYGCTDFFQSPLCQECVDKYYGSNCSQKCGHCLNDEACNKGTGNCDKGCQSNFQSPLCQECENGYYGSNCSQKCGHCLNDDACNKDTGHCDKGCQSNFQSPLCQVCTGGFYDSNCTSKCGHCMNEESCDKKNGSCSDCQANFILPLCQECKNGFYNNKCSEACGQCANNTICDKTTGHCTSGCKSNFSLPWCKECITGFYGDDCNIMCGNCNKTFRDCQRKSGYCLFGCDDTDDREWINEKCDETSPESNRDKDNDSSSTAAVVGGVVAALIVVAVVGLLGFFFRRRIGFKKNEPTGPLQFRTNQKRNGNNGNKYADLSNDPIERSTYLNEAQPGNDEAYYNIAEITTFIMTEELQRVISEKDTKENNAFLDEYKRLPVGNFDICLAGQQQENIVKNRFKTTFPYDHSRVILNEKWKDTDNDYVNANFMRNSNGERAYIAAQGPKSVTLADFWRMIWQENVKFIVMLTNVIENGKNKCTQYWPEQAKVLDVGPCKIKLLEEIVYAFYTKRRLTVQQNNSSKRTIIQFHYTAWPDHGTPEELGLVQFHRAVTQKYQTGGLMLVHCSAGVGRTGTFIGLDSLLKQGQESGRINVFEFVRQMREDRMTMVQTADQYIFLHKAILCELQAKDTVIRENDIPTKISSLLQDTSPLNQRPLYKEFKYLQTLKPSYDEKDREDGKTPENRDKNNDLKILPVSKYRPYLTSYIKGRTDYINAVCVPSFTDPGAFIITQYPLKDTEVDLWRLCMDHEVHALVVLEENNQGVSWIPQKGSSSCCTPYCLTTGNTGSSISGVSQDSLVISLEEQRKELDVFHIPFGNDNAILKGVELLLDKQKQNTSHTAVVLSKDGAEEVGVFCVLHNVLQQLRMDKEVDIFTSVRQIQTRRPEVISKLDEYRRCYELVPLSISEDGIYANM